MGKLGRYLLIIIMSISFANFILTKFLLCAMPKEGSTSLSLLSCQDDRLFLVRFGHLFGRQDGSPAEVHNTLGVELGVLVTAFGRILILLMRLGLTITNAEIPKNLVNFL